MDPPVVMVEVVLSAWKTAWKVTWKSERHRQTSKKQNEFGFSLDLLSSFLDDCGGCRTKEMIGMMARLANYMLHAVHARPSKCTRIQSNETMFQTFTPFQTLTIASAKSCTTVAIASHLGLK